MASVLVDRDPVKTTTTDVVVTIDIDGRKNGRSREGGGSAELQRNAASMPPFSSSSSTTCTSTSFSTASVHAASTGKFFRKNGSEAATIGAEGGEALHVHLESEATARPHANHSLQQHPPPRQYSSSLPTDCSTAHRRNLPTKNNASVRTAAGGSATSDTGEIFFARRSRHADAVKMASRRSSFSEISQSDYTSPSSQCEDSNYTSSYYSTQLYNTTESSHSSSRKRRPRPQTAASWTEASQPFLSRGKFVKKYFSDTLLMSSRSSVGSSSRSTRRKRVSFSSSSSAASASFSHNPPPPSCYVPMPRNLEAAEALENDILLASSYSSSSFLDDGALVDMARSAKKKVESVAKRQVMVGKWKPLVFGNRDCQVFDYKTKGKDQYSVVAKINLPCSLQEIMSVFSSDTSSEFHRSMVMLFGELYVYGLNVRNIDCAPYRRSSLSSLRRSSQPGTTKHPSGSSPSTKLAVNSVSLLMRHHLVWRQQNMSFVDYVEEKSDSKSVTRVMQTMDAYDDGEQPSPSALQAHETRHHVRGLRGLLVGYVLQEDSEEKFTRLFFYATHKSPDPKHQKLSPSAVQLIREIVTKLCKLESIVVRRRLGFYPMVAPSEVALLQTACCASCYLPFSVLRKKHFCNLCGHYTCRKCSSVEDIEKTLGMIDRRRVCVSCVRRVSYCVFTAGGVYQQQTTKTVGGAGNSALANVPEEEFPPILAEDDLALTEIEDLAIPDEHFENGAAVEQASTYMKKMFERNAGLPRKNPFHHTSGRAIETDSEEMQATRESTDEGWREEAGRATTPKAMTKRDDWSFG